MLQWLPYLLFTTTSPEFFLWLNGEQLLTSLSDRKTRPQCCHSDAVPPRPLTLTPQPHPPPIPHQTNCVSTEKAQWFIGLYSSGVPPLIQHLPHSKTPPPPFFPSPHPTSPLIQPSPAVWPRGERRGNDPHQQWLCTHASMHTHAHTQIQINTLCDTYIHLCTHKTDSDTFTPAGMCI